MFFVPASSNEKLLNPYSVKNKVKQFLDSLYY